MNCSELDHFLEPYLDGEFAADEQLEVDQHLAGCASCAQRVLKERHFRERLRAEARRAVASQPAPGPLHDRVLAGIRKEHRRQYTLGWMRAGAVALVIGTASGVYVHYRPSGRQKFLEDAARWHAKRLPFEIQQEKLDQVEAWFWGKLDHRISVPHLPNATVAGARLTNVKDRPAAYISYQAATPSSPSPKRLGLFVFDDADDDSDAKPLPSVQVASSHGYNVAIWREGEIVYELVSDLDEADIRNMLLDRNEPKVAAPAPPRPSLPVQPAALQR